MTIEVGYNSQLTVTETLVGEFVDPANNTITTNLLNTTTTLTASTTPPVSKYSAGRATMTAGAATIDLTSLPDSNGVAGQVNFTGLKVNAYKFTNPGANDIVVTEGASNGYPLHGAAFLFRVRPGEEVTYLGADVGTDVAAADRTIDITGTGTQYLEFELIAG